MTTDIKILILLLVILLPILIFGQEKKNNFQKNIFFPDSNKVNLKFKGSEVKTIYGYKTNCEYYRIRHKERVQVRCDGPFADNSKNFKKTTVQYSLFACYDSLNIIHDSILHFLDSSITKQISRIPNYSVGSGADWIFSSNNVYIIDSTNYCFYLTSDKNKRHFIAWCDSIAYYVETDKFIGRRGWGVLYHLVYGNFGLKFNNKYLIFGDIIDQKLYLNTDEFYKFRDKIIKSKK